MIKNLLILMSLFGGLSAQASVSKEIYLVEPMKCVGKQVSAKGYGDIELVLTSFKSTRKDGSLANSLEIQTSYSSTFYLSPLYKVGDKIVKKLGAYDETLTLNIQSTKYNADGTWDHKLVGELTAKGTVVGDTKYALTCASHVVAKVSRIDNNLAKKPVIRTVICTSKDFDPKNYDGQQLKIDLNKKGEPINLTTAEGSWGCGGDEATDVPKLLVQHKSGYRIYSFDLFKCDFYNHRLIVSKAGFTKIRYDFSFADDDAYKVIKNELDCK